MVVAATSTPADTLKNRHIARALLGTQPSSGDGMARPGPGCLADNMRRRADDMRRRSTRSCWCWRCWWCWSARAAATDAREVGLSRHTAVCWSNSPSHSARLSAPPWPPRLLAGGGRESGAVGGQYRILRSGSGGGGSGQGAGPDKDRGGADRGSGGFAAALAKLAPLMLLLAAAVRLVPSRVLLRGVL